MFYLLSCKGQSIKIIESLTVNLESKAADTAQAVFAYFLYCTFLTMVVSSGLLEHVKMDVVKHHLHFGRSLKLQYIARF